MSKHLSKGSNKKTKRDLTAEVIKAFEKNPNKPLNYKQVSKILKINDHAVKQMINSLMNKLQEEKTIDEVRKGKYLLPFKKTYREGRIDITARGAGFVITEGEENDVYIAYKNIGNVMHRDTVKVLMMPQKKSGKLEGKVTEIIQRNNNSYVGSITIHKKKVWATLDGQKSAREIGIIPEGNFKVKNGDKVEIKLSSNFNPNERVMGKISRVLGQAGNNDVEMMSILIDNNFPTEFPDHVEAESQAIPDVISESEIKKRKDFRKVTTFTIDPVNAKDFDDALSIQKLKSGNWEIGVHIADVAHYVTPGSELDKEAINRGNSIYLVDRVIPMLPEVLSNKVCSLRPKEEKLTYSAVFELNENAEIQNEWFGRTVIYSDRRFSYEEAQDVLDTGKGDFLDELNTLKRLATILSDRRYKEGSIAFNNREVKFKLDENKNPIGVYVKESLETNKLIEDFMLLANRRVAALIEKHNQKANNNFPFVYRIHDSPDKTRLMEFRKFLKGFKYDIDITNDKTISQSLNKLLAEVKGKNEENVIKQVALKCMSKAVYSAQNIGHFGLAFDDYTHFTSPIRRYSDVMVHRLLTNFLEKEKPYIEQKKVETICKDISVLEKKAVDAERASIKFKQAQYLQNKIGEVFTGLISGVTEWGLYVEMQDNGCEGMISIRDLKDDYYQLDQANHQIVGNRYRNTFKLGDVVSVKLKNVDLIKRHIDLSIL
ncbi:MAG: ribonuclease R [Flavobacteriales bacterium]|nr:ribonuclease R [Flavobacteriales bacterium]